MVVRHRQYGHRVCCYGMRSTDLVYGAARRHETTTISTRTSSAPRYHGRQPDAPATPSPVLAYATCSTDLARTALPGGGAGPTESQPGREGGTDAHGT
eukprot:2801973-Rhodomonas_salina.1